MKISIHQPTFWPWLGLVHKISKSDVFVLLDSVEVSKGSFQYRNKFLCGENAKFITLPVSIKSRINFTDLEFKNNDWRSQHLVLIKNYYRKAPFFNEVYPHIESLYNNYYVNNPSEFIRMTMQKTIELFNINTKFIASTELNICKSKGDLVFEICRSLNATTYISGLGAKNYMTDANYRDFLDNNIDIEWQDFSHPVYDQRNKECNFIEGLSSLDMLFYEGITRSRLIFQNL